MPLDLESLAAVLDVIQHFTEVFRSGCRIDRPDHAGMISDYPILGVATSAPE